MDFTKELKQTFPNLSKEIDVLVGYGAINDKTAKVAIVRKSIEHIAFRKQDKQRQLADKLCVSERTIRRYGTE